VNGHGEKLMDIAEMVYEFPPKIVGGLGTYAMEITQQFVKMGCNVTVFTMNNGKLPTRELWHGVEVHRPMHTDISDMIPTIVAEDVRKWGSGLKFFADVTAYNVLSATKLVHELVKKEERKFDVVAAHDWLSIMSGAAVRKELGIPLVFHVHSTERGRTMGGGSTVISSMEYQGGQTADLVVTVSQAMRDELISLGFPEAKIRVCYNGVDEEKYNPERVKPEEAQRIREIYGIKESDLMIFFIGRLISVKGVDRLILAMPHILRKIRNAKLVIVGVGDMQPYLLNLVNAMKLEDSVKFQFEFIPEEERIRHYAACDVAVFPSLYEPFGIVSLEAMSMGKPVVVGASGISGMREQVVPTGPDQCGFHVNPHEPVDIAWGIISVLADPLAARRYGENARRRVLQYFTWSIAAKNTLSIYESLLRKT
jgi:glycosyltransferase involved in cell wall biosynthesis